MSVKKRDYGQGISIHEYSHDVGRGISAVDTAAFAWLRANHTGRPWLLRDNTTYRVDAPVDMGGIVGQHLVGASARSTVIMPTYSGLPALLMGGMDSHQSMLKDLAIEWPTRETVAASVGIEVRGWLSQSQIRNVRVFRAATGLNLAASSGEANPPAFFSNVIEHFVVQHWSNYAILLQRGGAGPIGTGNHWSNVYLNNNAAGVQLPCVGFCWFRTGDEQSFNQLNLEHAICSDRPVFMQEQGAINLDAFHIERVGWPDNRALVSTFSDRTILDIRSMVVNFCTPNPVANTQALFELADGVRITAQSVMVRDNVPATMYVGRWNGTAGALAHLKVDQLSNETGDIIAPTPTGFGQIPDQSFQRYNNEWYTMNDGGQRYRITTPGGVVTATPV